jgi:hypothetical protein
MACSLAILSLLFGGLFLYLTRTPPQAGVEVQNTNNLIQNIEQDAQEFYRATDEHRKNTEQKVVIIREQVQREIYNLSPDGLVRASLAEIELWRRSAGSSADTRPAGLDGGY